MISPARRRLRFFKKKSVSAAECQSAAQFVRDTELLSNFGFRIFTRKTVCKALDYIAISLSLVTVFFGCPVFCNCCFLRRI